MMTLAASVFGYNSHFFFHNLQPHHLDNTGKLMGHLLRKTPTHPEKSYAKVILVLVTRSEYTNKGYTDITSSPLIKV